MPTSLKDMVSQQLQQCKLDLHLSVGLHASHCAWSRAMLLPKANTSACDVALGCVYRRHESVGVVQKDPPAAYACLTGECAMDPKPAAELVHANDPEKRDLNFCSASLIWDLCGMHAGWSWKTVALIRPKAQGTACDVEPGRVVVPVACPKRLCN